VTKYRKMLNIPSSRQRKDWSLDPSSDGESHPAPHNGVHEHSPSAHGVGAAEATPFEHEEHEVPFFEPSGQLVGQEQEATE